MPALSAIFLFFNIQTENRLCWMTPNDFVVSMDTWDTGIEKEKKCPQWIH